ncbi:MAG: tetratricopeptide repeat protein [Gemmataceae bacterium]|nr:tetratricopeptide repeat protein [Gemmataceae bacterium]
MPENIQDAEVQRALEFARQKVLDKPKDAGAWGYLGKVLLTHLFSGDADFCFAQAARLDPAEPIWVYGRGLIALRLDPTPEKGLELLRQAVAAAESGSDTRAAMSLQLAEALLEIGDLDQAERLFRAEQERTPADPRAALGLGLIARARGNHAAAAKFLTLAQSSPYARKKATVQLAVLARAASDQKAAEMHEQQAAGRPPDPPWPDPLLNEVIRLQVGRRGLERQVDQLERGGRFAEAAQLYLDQLEKQPTAWASIGAGINLVRLRDYEQALPLLREGVRLEPDNAHARYSLALGLFTRAEREVVGAPNSRQAREWFQEAVEHARRAAERRPDHADAYLIWGLSLKHLGDPSAAVEPLRKGVACTPADRELQLGLGEALMAVGRNREAETHLENARQLDPNDRRPAEALERLRAKKE